jgi:site-specific recombinase XerD
MSEILISNLIDDFLTEIESVRRYSVNTVESYKLDLAQFNEFLSEKNISSIRQVNEKSVRLYLIQLSKMGLSKSSISRKLSSLRSFFDFVIQEIDDTENPAKKIKNPKFKRKLPSTINLDSFYKIIRLISEDDDVFRRNLNTAIFELLYGCSLRVSELCSLKVHDVDPANHTVKV